MPRHFKSIRTPQFNKRLAALPEHVQRLAHEAYELWDADPSHPSLAFNHLKKDVWSVRITDDYRALGTLNGDTVIWLWIGDHREYEKRI